MKRLQFNTMLVTVVSAIAFLGSIAAMQYIPLEFLPFVSVERISHLPLPLQYISAATSFALSIILILFSLMLVIPPLYERFVEKKKRTESEKKIYWMTHSTPFLAQIFLLFIAIGVIATEHLSETSQFVRQFATASRTITDILITILVPLSLIISILIIVSQEIGNRVTMKEYDGYIDSPHNGPIPFFNEYTKQALAYFGLQIGATIIVLATASWLILSG